MSDAASPEFLALQRALAGRYSLVREIGRGGMGVVYLARDVNLDRSVAIKLLPPAMAGDSELKERFLREARTAAQLSHPNIVPIHLVEERDGVVYFVMTVIEGESLGERVRRSGPLRSGEAVRVIQEVAWALAYAHGRGVVHRDIKPDNILIERTSGRAMLTDFGIARSTAISLTTPGLILGTLQYMAPEQTDSSAPIDGRSDLYALGVTAFYAMSGRLPFESENVPALIAAHLLQPAPPVLSVASGVPSKLAEAIDRCLLKDPSARWATGEALADALTEVGQTARAMPPSIRAFVTAVTGGLMQFLFLGVILLWASLLVPEQLGLVAKLFLALALFPVLTAITTSRAVAFAGFSARDIGDAVAADMMTSDRYTEHVRAETQRMSTWLMTKWGRILSGVVGVGEAMSSIMTLVEGLRRPATLGDRLAILGFATLAIWIGVELVGHALQVGPFKERLTSWLRDGRAKAIGFTAALWRSAPVRGMLAIAQLTVRSGAQRVDDATAHRPTEAILASAADEVFAALPAADRAVLAAVPDVVRHLESLAAGQRARKDVLDEAIASVGAAAGPPKRAKLSADLSAERASVEQRLRATVEALENLRLDLLRLRAGVGTTGDLTEAIDAARRLGQEVDYTLHGRDEAARVV